MRPLFCNLSVFQKVNPISKCRAGQPVENVNHRLIPETVKNRFKHFILRNRIERAGGFIQNQNRCILRNRPGNGELLCLPAGKYCAVRGKFPADKRIHFIWQIVYPFQHIGLLQRCFRILSLLPGKRSFHHNIFCNRLRKELKILKYSSELVSIRRDRILPNPLSVA